MEARRRSRPRARAADDLSAQGSGLRARQTQGGPHAPGNPTPTQAVNMRVNIEGLAKDLEVTSCSLVCLMMMVCLLLYQQENKARRDDRE